MHLKTKNAAIFAENRWVLFPKLSVNTGVRVEIGETDMSGVIVNYPENAIPNNIKHQFPLFGTSAQYELTKNINLYAGWSQAYRPVIFKDIIPGSLYEVADKNLKDAKGYNIEGGFRGNWKFLTWDVSYFQLAYNSRLGTLVQLNDKGEEIIYRTNIGNSVTKGLELFTQAEFQLGSATTFSVFTATSYMDAKYKNATLRTGNKNVSIDGNTVESVPQWQSRNGVTLRIKGSSMSVLRCYTAKSFADAFNSIAPTPTGSAGLVPSYNLFDFNANMAITKYLHLGFNLNNAFDKHYLTKRPQFYPGPGVWPSDGRTFSVTLAARI